MYTGSLPANHESYHNGYRLSVEDGKTGRQSRVVSRDKAISPQRTADSSLLGERQTEDLTQFAQATLSIADIILFGSL
jgi:hypothetical protein